MLPQCYRAVDLDLGEYFLNIPLNQKLIKVSGINLSTFLKEIAAHKNLHSDLVHVESQQTSEDPLLGVWKRCWMVNRPSPFWSIQAYYIAEEFIRGNENDSSNVFYWDSVKLNLIGNKDYDPRLPIVYKWNSVLNLISGDVKAYVDDLRAVGYNLEHSWNIARQISARIQY